MVNLPRGRIIGKLEHPVTGKPVDAAEAEHFMRADTPSAGVRRPVATRIVFRFLGRNADLRSAIAQTAILPVDSPSIEPRVRRLLAEPVGFHNPPSLSAIRAKAGAIERRRNSHEGLTKPWLWLSLCSVGLLLTLNSVSIIQI